MMISIRVYGILINEQQQVLVSDELIRGSHYTKFPGGGLEIGEGTRDCLKREFMEELALEVSIGDHIYTTDFYQQSAFNTDYQILSIYYYAQALAPIAVPLRIQPFHFDDQQMAIYQNTQQIESFRFIDLAAFGPESVTLPIDKIVAGMVRGEV